MKLVIGDKAYSTWSLRPWLVLRRCGVAFEEVVVHLNRPDTAAQIARHSPGGRVPALHVDDLTIWDSLAIVEWCAERFPDAKLWPEDERARAVARSVTCELHAGFMALRSECGMGPDHTMVGEPGPALPPTAALSADLRRLVELIRDARDRFGAGGPYLFGRWSIADAFYTPIAARVRHYRLDLAAHGDDGTATAYCRTLLEQPDFLRWSSEAAQ